MGQLGVGVGVLLVLLLWLCVGKLPRVSWALIQQRGGTRKSIRVGAVFVLLAMIFPDEGTAFTVVDRAVSAVRPPVICLGRRHGRVREADALAIG